MAADNTVKAEPLTTADPAVHQIAYMQDTIDNLTAALSIEIEKREKAEGALREIIALDVRPFEGMPADWRQQIDACHECQGWAKNHPIQQGICDTHRRPLYVREKHDNNEVRALGYRSKDIARAALTNPPITEEG